MLSPFILSVIYLLAYFDSIMGVLRVGCACGGRCEGDEVLDAGCHLIHLKSSTFTIIYYHLLMFYLSFTNLLLIIYLSFTFHLLIFDLFTYILLISY